MNLINLTTKNEQQISSKIGIFGVDIIGPVKLVLLRAASRLRGKQKLTDKVSFTN